MTAQRQKIVSAILFADMLEKNTNVRKGLFLPRVSGKIRQKAVYQTPKSMHGKLPLFNPAHSQYFLPFL